MLLEGGGRVLAAAVNEEGRSALHFAAALGKVDATRMLCQAGAVVDAQDRDGRHICIRKHIGSATRCC